MSAVLTRATALGARQCTVYVELAVVWLRLRLPGTGCRPLGAPAPPDRVKGLIRSFLHRHFGSEFFAYGFLSQGISLLQPHKLSQWDQSLDRQREHSAAMHADVARATAREAGGPPWLEIGLAQRRRALQTRLQLLRQEMQHRYLMNPIQREVLWRGDGTWWCRHAMTDRRIVEEAAACEQCRIYNCRQCQGRGRTRCRGGGQACQERAKAMRAGRMDALVAQQAELDRASVMARARRFSRAQAEKISEMDDKFLKRAYQTMAAAWDNLTWATD